MQKSSIRMSIFVMLERYTCSYHVLVLSCQNHLIFRDHRESYRKLELTVSTKLTVLVKTINSTEEFLTEQNPASSLKNFGFFPRILKTFIHCLSIHGLAISHKLSLGPFIVFLFIAHSLEKICPFILTQKSLKVMSTKKGQLKFCVLSAFT